VPEQGGENYPNTHLMML